MSLRNKLYNISTVAACVSLAGLATSTYFTMSYRWVQAALNPSLHFDEMLLSYRMNNIFNLFDPYVTKEEVLKHGYKTSLGAGIGLIIFGSLLFLSSAAIIAARGKHDSLSILAVSTMAAGGATMIAVGSMLVANAPNNINLFKPEIFVENILKPQFTMHNLSSTLSTDEALHHFSDFYRTGTIISWAVTAAAIILTASVLIGLAKSEGLYY